MSERKGLGFMAERLAGWHGRLQKSFEGFGMGPSVAHAAALGRDRVAADPLEELMGTFRELGLSEAQAREAAVGRDGPPAALSEASQDAEMARLIEAKAERWRRDGVATRRGEDPQRVALQMAAWSVLSEASSEVKLRVRNIVWRRWGVDLASPVGASSGRRALTEAGPRPRGVERRVELRETHYPR